MQTSPNMNLPIQINSASPAPKNARAKSSEGDGGQFSQSLSREMEQRKGPVTPPAAAPAKPAAAAKPQQQAAKPAEKAPASAAAPADAATTKDSASAAGTGASEPASERSRTAELASPVADMLALVASFNQPGAPMVPVLPAVPSAPAVALDPAAAAAATVAAAAGDPLLDPSRPAAMVPVEVTATPLPVPLASTGAPVAQTAAPVTPQAGADAAQTFTQVLANAAMPEVAKAAVEPGKLERTPLQAGAEPTLGRAPVERAGVTAAAAAPDALKALADPALTATPRGREAAAELPPMTEFKVGAPVTAPLQQAALAVAQSVNGPAGDKLPARVGTPAWDNQVAQKIVWMVGGAEQSASLTLNPPDLGPMQVVLSVTNEMASITFSSGQAEVRQALEDAMPKLREMMSENGIALGNATVNDGAPEPQHDGGKQANNGGRSGSGGEGGNGTGGTNGSAADAAARNDARPLRAGETRGLVDTFA